MKVCISWTLTEIMNLCKKERKKGKKEGRKKEEGREKTWLI
jgi:hypothetical protein